MGYIDKTKFISHKLPNIMDDELFDRFVSKYIKVVP